jgi:uncharacterized membrane protein YgaE (UPF0421/DUF939 family)
MTINSTDAITLPQGNNDNPSDAAANDIKEEEPKCSTRDHRSIPVLKLPPTCPINESAKFALRVSFALTLASLFILCFDQESGVEYPDSLWVYITAGIVSWQPTPDTGSVFKKAWERNLGTVSGGLLGLLVGAISLTFPDHGSSGQATYLGISNSLLSFVIAYCTCELGFRAHYSSILGTFTFGIALLAFYNAEASTAWRVALFRIVNIVVGGLIGSTVTLIVFPVSTKHLIESNVEDVKKQAGETAMEVLTSFKDDLPSFQSIVQDKAAEDAGHAAYKKGIADIQKVKDLFPLLDYDPFFKRMSQKQRKDAIELWKIKIGRTMRIQMNIVCLDNIVRSRLMGNDVLNCELLHTVGKHIKELLDSSRRKESRDQTAIIMLNDDLPKVRQEIAHHKKKSFTTSREEFFPTSEDMMRRLSLFDDASTNNIVSVFSMNQTCLFYQMVEALMIRCIRLHHV